MTGGAISTISIITAPSGPTAPIIAIIYIISGGTKGNPNPEGTPGRLTV